MWARKRLDIGWLDVLAGATRLMLPGRAPAAVRRLEQALPQSDQALGCLSVRSGFDLLLRSLNLPRGSEVIFSAVTIHDMPRIAVEHGLVPVPADLDLHTLAPTVAGLEAARTAETRMVVIAHLFGARVNLAPYAEFCRRHNLLLVEDCAQAWAGIDWTGSPIADISCFSFGTIKTATAYGGAVLYVRRSALLAAMRETQAADPVASRGWFFTRLCKNSFMKAVSLRPWYGWFLGLCGLFGKDYDRVVNGSVRGFPGPEFLQRIRKQMPAALAHLLRRRLTRYDTRRLDTRTARGRRLTELLNERLGSEALARFAPAVETPHHSFWVYPLQVADPLALIRGLYRAGFDATQGQSLCAVPPPAGREALRPLHAERFLREIVFLPIYFDLPAKAVDRLAAAVLAALPAETESRAVAAPVGRVAAAQVATAQH